MKLTRKAIIDLFCGATVLVGALVIVGWALNISILKTVLTGYITMKANTAVFFCGFAISIWTLAHYQRKRWSFPVVAVFSLIASIISALTLIEYAAHLNFGIDEFLFKDLDGITGRFPPGRLAPI